MPGMSATLLGSIPVAANLYAISGTVTRPPPPPIVALSWGSCLEDRTLNVVTT